VLMGRISGLLKQGEGAEGPRGEGGKKNKTITDTWLVGDVQH